MGTTSVRLFPGDSAARVRGELAAGVAGAGGRFVAPAPAPAPAPEQSGEGGRGGAVRQNGPQEGRTPPAGTQAHGHPAGQGRKAGRDPAGDCLPGHVSPCLPLHVGVPCIRITPNNYLLNKWTRERNGDGRTSGARARSDQGTEDCASSPALRHARGRHCRAASGGVRAARAPGERVFRAWLVIRPRFLGSCVGQSPSRPCPRPASQSQLVLIHDFLGT